MESVCLFPAGALAVTGRFAVTDPSVRDITLVFPGDFIETAEVVGVTIATEGVGCATTSLLLVAAVLSPAARSGVERCQATSTTSAAIVNATNTPARDRRAGSARFSQSFA